jgi:Uma2 family endonuclease
VSITTEREMELEQPPVVVGDPDALFEIVDGQRVELPPMGAKQSVVGSMLVYLLNVYTVPRDLGLAVGETLFDLGPDFKHKRRPDVAYVSYERWPKGKSIPQGNTWSVVPDLVIEVVSPSDTAGDLLAKVSEFFRAGSRLFWVIHTNLSQVYVYESPKQVRILDRDATLEGGAILPGFTLPLASLLDE